MSSLNREQQAAVKTRGGRLLLNAAAGSGKTRVIVTRVGDIVKEGVRPGRILSTTFTKEGAREMENRAARMLLGVEPGVKVPQTKLDEALKTAGFAVPYGHHVFCTFHSLALRFIRSTQQQYFPHLQSMPLASGGDTSKCLRIAAQRAGLDGRQRKELASFISRMKRQRIDPEQAAEECEGDYGEAFAQGYATYEKEMYARGVLDFDDLLVKMCQLLEDEPDVRRAWQFEYVQVDEAQDTDGLQFAIVRYITEKFGNLLLVGDENQGMYGFRGAEDQLEKNFRERYPDGKVLILPENYRSTGEIVDFCKQIAPNQNEAVTNLRTANARGSAPQFVLYANEGDEANGILDALVDIPNSAVLTRTNAQLQPFEDACTDRKIPFQILGKGGFWRQYEVETAMAFIRVFASPTHASLAKAIRAPYNIVRAKRDEKDRVIDWLSQQKRAGVSDQAALPALARYPHPPFSGLFRFFERLKESTAKYRTGDKVRALFEQIGAITYYKDKSEEDDTPDNNKLENLERLIAIASKNESLQRFLIFAERVRHENKASKKALTLSTIHRSKGLEWLDVFVAGVNEGKLPSMYATSDDQVREERQVFYVACSRAARRLQVSATVPSEFFDEHYVEPIETAQGEVDLLETMYRVANND